VNAGQVRQSTTHHPLSTIHDFAPKEACVPDRELIIPNLHVVLIHYPLALVSIGTLIELFSFLWRRSTFRLAGRWMILIGALSLAPTALSGLHAMADLNRSDDSPGQTWADARAASPIQGQAWEQMRDHAWLNADACAILLFIVVIYLGSSDLWRKRMYWPFLILLLAGQGFMVAGAWHGGEMVYRHGIAVEAPNPSSSMASDDSGAQKNGGLTSAAAKSDDEPAGETADESSTEEASRPTLAQRLEGVAEPMDIHVLLAGVTIALALAALALSMRAGAQPRITLRSKRPPAVAGAIGSALNPYARNEPEPGEFDVNFTEEQLVALRAPSRVPVMRFWFLAFLVSVLTVAAGIWTLAHLSDMWDWHHVNQSLRDLWQMVLDKDTSGGSRRLAHVVVGVAIVALLLILSILGRWAAARQFILGSFALLLIVAVAAQIWFGSLLMFDTPAGPLTRFNPGTSNVQPAVKPSPAEEPKAAPAPASAPAPTSAPASNSAPVPSSAPAPESVLAPTSATAPTTSPQIGAGD
jgi:uncharacterized membrane protein